MKFQYCPARTLTRQEDGALFQVFEAVYAAMAPVREKAKRRLEEARQALATAKDELDANPQSFAAGDKAVQMAEIDVSDLQGEEDRRITETAWLLALRFGYRLGTTITLKAQSPDFHPQAEGLPYSDPAAARSMLMVALADDRLADELLGCMMAATDAGALAAEEARRSGEEDPVGVGAKSDRELLQKIAGALIDAGESQLADAIIGLAGKYMPPKA